MLETSFILGGVALILFGARFLNKGLDRLVGDRLAIWLDRMAGRRRGAFGVGLVLSIVAPSSTTMSVLTAQAVRNGLLDQVRALSLLAGTCLGMTLAVQLIALNIQSVAPALLAIGVALFMYTRHAHARGVGQILIAVGFIFLAMRLISEGAGGVARSNDLTALLEIAIRYPLLLALIGAVMTALLQSSKAAVGLLIGLGAGQAIDLHAAAATIVGVNIGLSITTLAAGWTDVNARRTGAALMTLKILVAVPCILLLDPIVASVSGLGIPDGTRIATLHTGFNLVLAVVTLPSAGIVSAVARRAIPAENGTDPDPFGPRHIRGVPIERTALAMSESMREVLHVSEVVRTMLDDAWTALKTGDITLAREVGARDDGIDMLDAEIKRFLIAVGAGGLDTRASGEQMLQLRYLNELENIGDVIDKNLAPLIVKKLSTGAEFSDDGVGELDQFHAAVRDSLAQADAVFLARDPAMARRLIRHKAEVNTREVELRDRHLERLIGGARASQQTTAIHLDMLTHLRRINSAASAVAYELLRSHNEHEVVDDR